MGRRRNYENINYTVKDGKLYFVSCDRPMSWESLMNMHGDVQCPTEMDRLNTMLILLDFGAITAPKEGALLDDIIPDFKTKHELYGWRGRKIHEYLNQADFQ